MGGKPDTGSSAKRIAVLGGGLAGLSAARRLLEHGYRVTLVEKRPFFGGRAYSFRDGREGVEVDNGQHVFLGCCTYYVDFLRTIGVLDKAYIQDSLRTEVVLNGKSGVLSSIPYLGSLHLLPSLLRYPHLSFREKFLAVYGMLNIKLADRSKGSRRLDGETGYDWLRRHGQSDRAIRNLWDLIILPTLNDHVSEVSADMTLMVFQVGLLGGARAAAIGLSRVGLNSLNGGPARRFIEERGGELKPGRSVKSVEVINGAVSGVQLSDGTPVIADAYVSALPYEVLLQVLPDEVARDPFFCRAAGLRSSPIVGIHLWYDRPIMDQEFVAFLDSPVQWVFNKSRIQGDDAGDGQYVCISLSGAWQHIDTPKDRLREIFVHEMARLFPRAREASVERFLVVKEAQATFRSVPGAAGHRLPQETPIPNLFLAGEWTETGWPSTMEGAVRSGVFAADRLAERV